MGKFKEWLKESEVSLLQSDFTTKMYKVLSRFYDHDTIQQILSEDRYKTLLWKNKAADTLTLSKMVSFFIKNDLLPKPKPNPLPTPTSAEVEWERTPSGNYPWADVAALGPTARIRPSTPEERWERLPSQDYSWDDLEKLGPEYGEEERDEVEWLPDDDEGDMQVSKFKQGIEHPEQFRLSQEMVELIRDWLLAGYSPLKIATYLAKTGRIKTKDPKNIKKALSIAKGLVTRISNQMKTYNVW